MPTAIIPIILTIAVGYLLERRRPNDVKVLATIAIYVLLPALIFSSLLSTTLTLRVALPVAGVAAGLLLSLWLLGKLVGVVRRHDARQESFWMLTTIFMNAGNMGMPVALYAFGDRGLDLAVIWVLVVNTSSNFVAVYYACRHRGGQSQAFRTVLTLPTLYAALLAFLLRGMDVHLPVFLADPIQLIGRSVIPVSQLLLGMQLAKVRSQVGDHLGQVLAPGLVRLVASPLVALGLAHLLGVHGLAAKVAVLLAAMPTGINMAIYATEFDAQPRLVATAVFVSTLASFVTLSLLLVLLR
jgi:malate permease and related proteins